MVRSYLPSFPRVSICPIGSSKRRELPSLLHLALLPGNGVWLQENLQFWRRLTCGVQNPPWSWTLNFKMMYFCKNPLVPAHGLEKYLLGETEMGTWGKLSLLQELPVSLKHDKTWSFCCWSETSGHSPCRKGVSPPVTNNQEIISCSSSVAAACSPSERAWERGILLIVLSLPGLQVSDDLIGLTCS